MAYARKCDRCGNYYDKNKGDKTINGCSVIDIRIETQGSYLPLDLCDSCIDELYSFLHLNNKEARK